MPGIVIGIALCPVLISDPRPLIEEPAVAAPRDSVEPRDSERPIGGGPHRFGALASTEHARHVNRRETAHPPTPTKRGFQVRAKRTCSSVLCGLSTAAIFRQPSILRNLICPLATRRKSRQLFAESAEVFSIAGRRPDLSATGRSSIEQHAGPLPAHPGSKPDLTPQEPCHVAPQPSSGRVSEDIGRTVALRPAKASGQEVWTTRPSRSGSSARTRPRAYWPRPEGAWPRIDAFDPAALSKITRHSTAPRGCRRSFESTDHAVVRLA